MTLAIDNYLFDPDREATRLFYEKRSSISIDDPVWRNYMQAIETINPFVRKVMGRFGIDLLQPESIHAYDQLGDKILYRGVYFMIGHILQGKEPWKIQVDENGMENHEFIGWIANLGEDFSAFFSDHGEDAPKGMPRPIIRMDYRIALPWVIDEKNIFK